MVNAVGPSSSNVKTSIFYVNDIHGQVPKMEQITNASTQFDAFVKQQNKLDSLKLSSGDTFIGKDPKTNLAAASFLDNAGIQASTLGNHEFDGTASLLAQTLDKVKNTKFLGMNLNFPQNSPLEKNVTRSTVIESNGNKYGIIGLEPIDINVRIKSPALLEGITVDDDAQTLKELQEEVNKLQQQGLDKIILLSHTGNEREKKIAQSISGIDVILGGHSHDLIEGIEQGKNLFYSPSGEPVVITQAGKDGNNFGILNLEFNDKGQIVSAQNNVMETQNFNKNLLMSTMTDKILGSSPVAGKINSIDPFPKKNLIEENALAEFVTDAAKEHFNADIVLLNSATIRGSIAAGDVKERDIRSLFPFKNKLCKVQLSEKDFIDALNHGGSSITKPDLKPGILQGSGFTYTLNKEGKVVEAAIIDKNNQKHPIDVNNPNPNKMYNAIYDDFLTSGADKFTMLKRENPDKTQEAFDDVLINHMKAKNTPFDIKKDGRIKFV